MADKGGKRDLSVSRMSDKQWQLSPSQFSQVQQCGYRYLLKVSGTPALPTGGAAVLGLVLHGILETHAHRPFTDVGSFEQEWQQQISKQEQRLTANPVTAALVPLARNVRNYAVKKAALRRSIVGSIPLQSMARLPHSSISTGLPGAEAKLGTEVELGKEGRITGRADLIRRFEGGIEIVDYKTGRFTASDGSSLPVAKPEYAQQLKLYAALYQAETGKWPARGLLLGLASGEVTVSFEPAECLDLLKQANVLLNTLEEAAVSGMGFTLARPAPEICRLCSYRPNCSPYLSLLSLAGGVLGADILGQLNSSGTRSNRLSLSVATETGPVSIQAVGGAVGRLAAEAAASTGRKVVVFGVRHTPGTCTFTAGPTTVIYTVDENYITT